VSPVGKLRAAGPSGDHGDPEKPGFCTAEKDDTVVMHDGSATTK
jgi:hypothetical protein